MSYYIHHHTAALIRKHEGIGNGSTPATAEEVEAVVAELEQLFGVGWLPKNIPLPQIVEV